MRVALAGLSLLVAAGGAAATGDVSGLWRTEPKENGAYITVRIGPCPHAAEERCGWVQGVYGGARPDIVGDEILRGMEPVGKGRWDRGEIVRPGRGDVYRSRMELAGDELRVEGCVVGGLFCGGQTWTRVR